MCTFFTVLLAATAAVVVGCASHRRCAPPDVVGESRVSCAPHHDPISTTTTHYVNTFFNDGQSGTIISRRENVFGPGAETYDVREFDGVYGAVEVVLLKLPDLAREQGAAYAELGGGALRIIGPPKAHSLVRETLAMLRASPGPRP